MQLASSNHHQSHRARFASLAAACLALATLPIAQATSASAATLDRVKETKKLTLGYRADAQPFSFKDQGGQVAGYSVALCQKVAEQVKADLGLSELKIEWVPVTAEDRFTSLQQGKIDLLCGASTATLTRRRDVSFSIPIFPSGVGALLRADAPAPLRQILEEGQAPSHPVWRGSPARTVLDKKTYSVVTGTTAATWLPGRIKTFEIDANVAPVPSYDAGVQLVVGRSTDVFFGDRPMLLEAANRSPAAEDLIVLDRLFTYEPLALAVPRGDEDLRFVVDRSLSQLFRSQEFAALYTKWFGKPDDDTTNFFRQSALPD